ncbi:MAG TPA: EAL domain-containing protein, partial [Burkholderiaceae bacterium]|nr:EAL domain-containing protein [Burkholderiaceae bacterium]
MNERRNDPFRCHQGPRLGKRLTRAVFAATGVALLVAGLIFDVYVYFSQRNALLDDVSVQARILAENSSAAILFDDRQSASQTLAGLQASTAILHAQLIRPDGRVLASFRPENAARAGLRSPPFVKAASHEFVRDTLVVDQPVGEANMTVGALRLVADLQPLYERVAMHVVITVLAAAAALGFAFAVVVRIRRDVDATEARLDYLAYYDPVTGLPNRHAASEQIDRLMATVGHTSDGFGLLMLDLDDFKVVNDTLGHPIGDKLLRAIASRLSQYIHSTHIACRFGGDEFVVIAPRLVGRPQLEVLGIAVLRALEDSIVVEGHEIRARCSVGLAQYPADARDAASLIRAADTALYEAKARGKNTFSVYAQDMERKATLRIRLDADLRRAIENNELYLAYQPIVRAATGATVGVEALLRWAHPELGEIAPAEFIPLAESSGAIVDIGQWVLDEACRQIRRWSDDGHRVFVAVNVSAKQIRRGLRAQIDVALAASGADPRLLEIEITEHSMVEDIDSNVAQLAALSSLGIRVAVDDFGTGLSSLAYLKRLPINKLKIDRAFVKDLPQSSDDLAIAQAIVSLAHSLALTVVAEGIETEQQRRALVTNGCDYLQG